MSDTKSTGVVLIIFAHEWDAALADQFVAEDLLEISIVHKPRLREYENAYGDTVKKVDSRPACGSKLPDEFGWQPVARRVVNMRNVRKCQQRACFGASR